jgi:hypothetical protein
MSIKQLLLHLLLECTLSSNQTNVLSYQETIATGHQTTIEDPDYVGTAMTISSWDTDALICKGL